MIPKLDSPETLRILAGLVGGMRGLHLLLEESGFNITYTTLSKYVSNGAQFEERVFANLFETMRKKNSFTAREAIRNFEDAYIVLNELVAQGVFLPKKIGEGSELDGDWEKRQTLTKEEIKDFEAEFGTKLSEEQKQVLQGKRRKDDFKKPTKSSVSLDDLFDDDDEEEEQVVTARNEKAEVIVNPTKEEAEEFLEPEPKKEVKSKSFMEELFEDDDEEFEQVSQNGLTDPFESELRKTPDVFTSENQRI